MKYNKWTLGLAAVGAVSLASAVTARADGTGNLNAVQAAAAGLSIGGSIDTSIEWAMHPSGDNFANSPGSFIPFRSGKQDGFNLNKVKLVIEKPLDESEWASGGKVELWFGPDAVNFNTSANAYYLGDNDFAIKQAYVALRTPVGNGLDWKIGVFDTIIGYESSNAESNPNFTRSWGYAIEPTQHTGILASYKFSDLVSGSAGIANTWSANINARNTTGDGFENMWCKTWMASIALTAPDSWGSLAGSTLYGGLVYGFDANQAADQRINYYVGTVIKTPVEGLTTGVSFDYTSADTGGVDNYNEAGAIGLYASYKATEKLSLHARGEYVAFDVFSGTGGAKDCLYSLTGTVQYDLWANVISRLELRYDTVGNNGVFGTPAVENQSWLLAANIIYTF